LLRKPHLPLHKGGLSRGEKIPPAHLRCATSLCWGKPFYISVLSAVMI